MFLDEFRSNEMGRKEADSNLAMTCNALYKSAVTVNCYLTCTQAITLAQHLLFKAQAILDNGLEDAAVHLWNTSGERLHVGMTKARKGPRRKQSRTKKRDAAG